MTHDDELQDILRRVVEANNRCLEVRVKLIQGEIAESEVGRAYAAATAPLAAAARAIVDLAIIEGRG